MLSLWWEGKYIELMLVFVYMLMLDGLYSKELSGLKDFVLYLSIVLLLDDYDDNLCGQNFVVDDKDGEGVNQCFGVVNMVISLMVSLSMKMYVLFEFSLVFVQGQCQCCCEEDICN